ncbi:GTP cyclohydrolase I [Thermoanaerobacter mathranii subsp. mathranii str. A3]|jgi:GTP cyclohydrolase I|uniref:GTP cyclohydrolase 1 n=3 Tax=Thermoanaerobacter TaxID=1754 RepID=D3T4X9_THEIA|nr:MULTISPECIES: GTP cyclohydrolase I FolE [Thermoanaerobacter]ADD03272.1 GTP cyclohydrolase I [Thermoanaerobacter italicus Ab9]ADH61678.1 GTP cyclohydrolase I [Thermoanaerobacter mathranii subsp. mathranii str. A3]MBT1278685.1 GTP cyclohydrolase I FolE [Thermoanaerobacter sp. CM-CNRG TB177]MDP9751582.1 GTP cyclohydrolase I [Thermoanaerobacter pentosaceus]
MIDKEKIKKAVRDILEAIGENPDREGLLETPDRVARMYEEIFAGLHTNVKDVIKIFQEDEHQEIILVKDIPLYSMCEHHLLPFIGVAHVAYLPRKGRILGLSKLARIVDILAKRPQLQERLTSEIADTIMEAVNPLGVAVVIEAEHLCMTMRGVKKPGSKTVTSALRGIFRTDQKSRAEVMSLINSKK